MNKQLITILAFIGAASSALATLDVVLPGNSEEAYWDGLIEDNHPGYPVFATSGNPWPAPIIPSLITPGSEVPEFDKVAGYGYPAGAGIYVGSNTGFLTGTYQVSVDSALTGLETVIFQIDESEYYSTPTFSYNNGEGTVEASYSATSIGYYQWDLTGVASEILSFAIEWEAAAHSSITALQLNQGDTYVQVVPEPSTYALLAGVACGALILMRRQRR
ncbi:PEP-CTERM sorting domain-containing protein [Cerasicoccus frondis]|uniref:PEP-CTERM sorting domain-containing protein n=1 Tax=Cerasicoccus frondis TaxID=490090 RepID=UPI002852B255|nr:PEP-CTERM sorting domain-containing protein [Cerasicoccus frondis]